MEKAKWITPGRVILVALVAIAVWAYAYANDLWNTAIPHQTGLNGEYKSGQAYLSSYEAGFYEGVGVANLKSAKMDKIISDAVKGRYDGDTSAKPGGGSLFSAIAEAYPTLDLNVYDKMLDYIKAGRAEYRGKQDALIARLQAFDSWRKSNIIQSIIIDRILGIPNKDLVACAGPDDCKYGADAEQRMWNIVLTEGAENAYKTSKMKPLAVPQN